MHLRIEGFPTLPDADVQEVAARAVTLSVRPIIDEEGEFVRWQRGAEKLSYELGFVCDLHLLRPEPQELRLGFVGWFDTPMDQHKNHGSPLPSDPRAAPVTIATRSSGCICPLPVRDTFYCIAVGGAREKKDRRSSAEMLRLYERAMKGT